MTKSEKREKYTFDFKKQMVLEHSEHGYSYGEMLEMFGVPTTTMARWAKIYEKEGITGLQKKHKGNSNGSRPVAQKKFKAKKDETIQNELERLRAENAYLKKLNALVQERELREKRPRQSGN